MMPSFFTGEKQSVLKKLFGRSKSHDKKNRSKDNSDGFTSPNTSVDQDSPTHPSAPLRQEISRKNSQRQKSSPPAQETPLKKEVELATFSAQFPPPEWTWYEQQQQQQQIQANHIPQFGEFSFAVHGVCPMAFSQEVSRVRTRFCVRYRLWLSRTLLLCWGEH